MMWKLPRLFEAHRPVAIAAALSMTVLSIGVLQGCAEEARDRENYGEMDSIDLDERHDHVPGWEREACLMCHTSYNIHRSPNAVALISDPDQVIKDYQRVGSATCTTFCHQGNGLPATP